jgi:hypothetical protein
MVNLNDAMVALRTIVPVPDETGVLIRQRLDKRGGPSAGWLDAWPIFSIYEITLKPILTAFGIEPLDYPRYNAFSKEIWRPLKSLWGEETKANVVADVAARWATHGCNEDVMKAIATWAIKLLNMDGYGTAAEATANTPKPELPKPEEPKPGE